MLSFVVDKDEVLGLDSWIRRHRSFPSFVPTAHGESHVIIPTASPFNCARHQLNSGVESLTNFVEKFGDCQADFVRSLQVTEMSAGTNLDIVAVRETLALLGATMLMSPVVIG
jgi:hypothetical protein